MAHRYAEFYVILSPVESVSFPIQRVPCYKLYFTYILSILREIDLHRDT